MIAKIKHYWNEWINAILFIVILLTLPILLFVFFHLNISLMGVITFLILLFELNVIFVCGYFLFPLYLDKVSMSKNEIFRENCGNKYSAVLIGNNLRFWKNISTHSFVYGLFFLIKFFKNTNKKYVIFPKIDMPNFDRFVLDDKCQELYIVGHGSKGSFRINNRTDENDGIIYYSKYKDAPKKIVIAQLHCANLISDENNESLVDSLADDKDNSYVGCCTTYFPNIWWYCFNKWIKSIPLIIKLKRHLFYIIKCIQK